VSHAPLQGEAGCSCAGDPPSCPRRVTTRVRVQLPPPQGDAGAEGAPPSAAAAVSVALHDRAGADGTGALLEEVPPRTRARCSGCCCRGRAWGGAGATRLPSCCCGWP